MTRIKTELSEEFKKVFTDRLTANGETVTTAAGTGVLLLRPAIIDLDVSAPDRADPAPARHLLCGVGWAGYFVSGALRLGNGRNCWRERSMSK